MKRTFLVIGISVGIIALALAALYAYQLFFEVKTNLPSSVDCRESNCPLKKPAIYLYPKTKQEVSVNLLLSGELLFSYPEYNNGWSVTAYPDGKIINSDGKEYSYLFWEGAGKNNYNLDKGFVVKGSETKAFLQQKLAQIGLTPKEYNEMIVYWLPRMEKNKYNLIHFAGDEYTKNAKLDITPKPDSLLRVFMVFKPLENYKEVAPQTFKTFERKGFSVVEWGGTELR